MYPPGYRGGPPGQKKPDVKDKDDIRRHMRVWMTVSLYLVLHFVCYVCLKLTEQIGKANAT